MYYTRSRVNRFLRPNGFIEKHFYSYNTKEYIMYCVIVEKQF